MQLSGGWLVAIGIGAIILAIAISASFFSVFVRETSGIQERWAHKTLEERANLSNAIEALNMPSYVASSGGFGPPSGSGDFDNDGIPDSEDPDPTNPDTDGDGTIDGADPSPEDPTDPEDGGGNRRPPRAPQPPTLPSYGNLRLESLIKQVRDSDEDWGHSVKTAPGETANFRIELVVDNQDNEPHTLVLADRMSSGLTFEYGTIQVPSTGDDRSFDQWGGSQTFVVGTGQHTLIFTFTATVETTGLLANEITVYDADLPYIRLTDTVFLVSLWTHPSGAPQPGGVVVINNLDKQVKHSSDFAYQDSITTRITQPPQVLDFRILISVDNAYATPRTAVLTDSLPAALQYQSGSSRGDLDIDKLFNQGGYLSIILQPGHSTYEAIFSATVITEDTAPVSNKAQLYDNRYPLNSATDITPIYFFE